MKEKVVVMLAGILALLNLKVVNAASLCSVEDQAKLNKIAGSVKAVYEEAKEELDPSTYITTPETGEGPFYKEYFKIIFTNITEEVYVKITNDYNDEVKFIRYQDTDDGMYTFDWNDLDAVVKFTYEVYSSDKTACQNEKYFTNYLVTPKLNEFYNYLICDGIKDYLACQKYIPINMGYNEQYNKIVEYKEAKKEKEIEENKKWYEKIGDFVKKHKTAVIVGGSIIVIAGVAIVVVIIKRKREDVL